MCKMCKILIYLPSSSITDLNQSVSRKRSNILLSPPVSSLRYCSHTVPSVFVVEPFVLLLTPFINVEV